MIQAKTERDMLLVICLTILKQSQHKNATASKTTLFFQKIADHFLASLYAEPTVATQCVVNLFKPYVVQTPSVKNQQP